MIKKLPFKGFAYISSDQEKRHSQCNRDFYMALSSLSLVDESKSIQLEYFISYPEEGYYCLDVHLIGENEQIQEELDRIYKAFYQLPEMQIPSMWFE